MGNLVSVCIQLLSLAQAMLSLSNYLQAAHLQSLDKASVSVLLHAVKWCIHALKHGTPNQGKSRRPQHSD